MKRVQKLHLGLGVLSLGMALAWTQVQAETFTLRIGAGHPATSIGYVVAANKFFVPETAKRVAARNQIGRAHG